MQIKVDDLVQTEEDSNGHLLLLPYGEFGLVEN